MIKCGKDCIPSRESYKYVAVIVSNKLEHCQAYCYFKHLDKRDYKFVCNYQGNIDGLPRDTPIIITYCSEPLDDYLRLALFHYFDNIFLEDY